MSGSESPTTMSWNAKNQRVRTDISKTRLRAIENSLENGQLWVPPSPGHRKTWEEEVNFHQLLIMQLAELIISMLILIELFFVVYRRTLNGLCMIIFFSENLQTPSVMFCWTVCKELKFKRGILWCNR